MNEVATFATGCFWCTEAIFQQLRGIITVVSGYTGGHRDTPTYEQVVTGVSGHAEAIQITFDPQIISYETLLDIFWHTHNPTTKNQQGNDIGTQYRSAIFYHSPKQKELALASLSQIETAKEYAQPIVTQIEAATKFYPAESYHANYYQNNPQAPYCQFVIAPKLEKFWAEYKQLCK